jgi:beta-lactamase regulating signal transducer with metallopeptidase domain
VSTLPRPTPEAQPEVRVARRLAYTTALLVVYLAGVLVVLVRIAVDHAVVWRLTREARPMEDARWTELLESLATRSRLRRPVVMLQSSASVMPLTLGLVRPRVVVPAVADSWPPTMQRAVVMHELAHVDRRDCLTQSLAAIACALYWPNPLIWWAAARLRVERELACDDLVLARGIRPHDYASHLLDAARALCTPRLAVSMAAASGLEHRLRAVIDETRRRAVPSPRSVVLAAASTLLIAAMIAAVRPGRVEAAPAAVAPRGDTPTPQRATQGGSFAVRPATLADGPANAGRIHFMLQTPGLNTFYEEPTKVDGLTREQLAVVGAPLRFRLRRDAGTFEFTGSVRNGYGAGRFEFVPDATFADSLARRGIRAPSAEQQFSLARHDVSLAYVNELLTQGYAVPTIEQLVHAGTTGADLDYIREMAALGYRERTIDGMIRVYNQGVDPAFIKEANARAGRTLTVAELVQYRNSGVSSLDRPARPPRGQPSSTPSDSSASSAPNLPLVDDTVVTGRWTIAARPDGWLQLDIDWANVNQWRRFVRPPDLPGLGANDLDGVADARFRIDQDAGVFEFNGTFARGRGDGRFVFRPNQGFPATLRALGVRDAERVGIHQLKNLAFGFISAASVREFIEAGLQPLTLNELLDLAVRQVSPAYLREMKAAGIQGAESVRGIVELKFHDVPASYARDLSALGYKTLTYRQLIEMYQAAVTPGFIRQQRATAGRDLTPEELIDLRARRQ